MRERAIGAYVDGRLTVEPAAKGKLSGLKFAVKDVFSVRGHTSGAGNPDWLRTHHPAPRHAEAVRRLLENGATLAGITHTDELMYSLNGENDHYGTPVNPKAPDRIPGGSSSGSAVAVAEGSADFALGTDTGGSVRVPASYCGVFGFRPTHGAVPADGVIPLAESFDTVGWMARSADLLRSVGEVLLGGKAGAGGEPAPAADGAAVPARLRVLLPKESWACAPEASREALRAALDACRLEGMRLEPVTLTESGLADWVDAFRVLQGWEIWKNHGAWISEVRPKFGPDIAARFRWAASLTDADRAAAARRREEIRAKLDALLAGDTLIAQPTTPSSAPLRGMAGEKLEALRSRTLMLCCIAGLGGLPQVTLPLAETGGAPVGLSFIARRGMDLPLLAWAAEMTERFRIREERAGDAHVFKI